MGWCEVPTSVCIVARPTHERTAVLLRQDDGADVKSEAGAENEDEAESMMQQHAEPEYDTWLTLDTDK